MVGNAIFIEIRNVVGRIEANLRYFNGKAAQNKMDLRKIQGSALTLSNTKYFFINEKYVLLSPCQ